MNKTLYITDLDGTFLDSNSKLSNKTKEKLIKLLDLMDKKGLLLR